MSIGLVFGNFVCYNNGMTQYSTMPENARVWVYASNRILSGQEQKEIREKASSFIQNWTSHQIPVKATFDLLEGCFFIWMVDVNESEISGCGIDKVFHFMQQIQQDFRMDVFNRMQVELDSGKGLIITTKEKAKQLVQSGVIHSQTTFFNKAVQTKSDFGKTFRIPFHQSWVMKRVLSESVN